MDRHGITLRTTGMMTVRHQTGSNAGSFRTHFSAVTVHGIEQYPCFVIIVIRFGCHKCPAVVQGVQHQPGKISHGLLSVSNDVGQVENYASRLQAQYPDLEIRPVRKVSASEGQVLDKIKGLMGLVSIVILALSSLCVNTTLMAIVGERAREFALQKALGSSTVTVRLACVRPAASVQSEP